MVDYHLVPEKRGSDIWWKKIIPENSADHCYLCNIPKKSFPKASVIIALKNKSSIITAIAGYECDFLEGIQPEVHLRDGGRIDEVDRIFHYTEMHPYNVEIKFKKSLSNNKNATFIINFHIENAVEAGIVVFDQPTTPIDPASWEIPTEKVVSTAKGSTSVEQTSNPFIEFIKENFAVFSKQVESIYTNLSCMTVENCATYGYKLTSGSESYKEIMSTLQTGSNDRPAEPESKVSAQTGNLVAKRNNRSAKPGSQGSAKTSNPAGTKRNNSDTVRGKSRYEVLAKLDEDEDRERDYAYQKNSL